MARSDGASSVLSGLESRIWLGRQPTVPLQADLWRKGARVDRCVQPLLKLAMGLSDPTLANPPTAEVVYAELRRELDATADRLQRAGVDPSDVNAIKYALVAFVDERMLLPEVPYREFWQTRRLQLEFFGETRAGEGFFERLRSLIRTEARQIHVLRIYYLCLLLGFEGMYRQLGGLERENILDETRHALQGQFGVLDRAKCLSPQGGRPDEPEGDRRRSPLMNWFAASLAVVAIAVWLGLLFTVDAQEQRLNRQIQHVLFELGAGYRSVIP